MPFWSTNFGEETTLKDPKRAFRFTVSITGIDSANGGPLVWYATSVAKPSFEVTASEHKFLNHTFFYPGNVKWNTIDLKMVDPAGDPDVAATLAAMISASGYSPPTDSTTESFTSISKAKAAGALGTIIISQIDSNGLPIEKWTLINSFATKVDFGGELSYGEEKLTEYSMTIQYDWARVETLEPSSAVALGGDNFFGI
jgi:hypothetical protein